MGCACRKFLIFVSLKRDGMPLASDLLEQAEHLSNRESSGPPKQASLRRAVSSAYYAMFHLLASAAAFAVPPNPPSLRGQVHRALLHDEMKDACKGISSSDRLAAFSRLSGPPSAALIRIATIFVDLQEARHKADYDNHCKTDTYRGAATYTSMQSCVPSMEVGPKHGRRSCVPSSVAP